MALRVYNGRYEIVQHLARGGMAEVFLARDLLLDRPVAIKVLFPEFAADRSFVERFRREARSAANLNHPNIVSIYDWGEEEGTYFIVMEYVEGRTLRQMIREDGPLPPRRAAEIGADLPAAPAQPQDPCRVRGHRPQVTGQEPGQPVRVRRGTARRPHALPLRPASAGNTRRGRSGGRSRSRHRGGDHGDAGCRQHPGHPG